MKRNTPLLLLCTERHHYFYHITIEVNLKLQFVFLYAEQGKDLEEFFVSTAGDPISHLLIFQKQLKRSHYVFLHGHILV